MRAYCHKAEFNNLTIENKPVHNKIQKNIKYCVCSTGYGVTENLRRYKTEEGKIKSINNPDYQIADFFHPVNHILNFAPCETVDKETIFNEIQKIKSFLLPGNFLYIWWFSEFLFFRLLLLFVESFFN